MIIYTRGDRIPPDKRDRRFFHKGQPSEAALLKYWKLLPDGSPDPDCKPFWRRWEIEMLHRAYPDLGEYRIDADPPGRKKVAIEERKATFDRKAYDQQRYEARKNQG